MFHGTSLDDDPNRAERARCIAAGALKAILEWRAFVRRMGAEYESFESMLRELKGGKYVPGQLTGTDASPVTFYWRIADKP